MENHVTNEDLGAKVEVIQSRLDGLTQAVERFIAASESRHNALEARFSERGQFRWPILFGAITVIAVLIGGAFTILKQQTDLSVALALAPVLAQNQVSITDRAEMRATMGSNAQAISQSKEEDKKFAAQLIEIETQLSRVYNDLNAQHVQTLSDIARLWQKSYGEPYPIVPYFPQPRILPQ